jgi:hypothetical protein
MNKKVGIPFTVDMTNITDVDQVVSNCNDIIFINQGIAPARISRCILLQTGQSWGPGGNAFEFDTTIYQVQFEPANAGDAQDLVVIRKSYNSNPGDQWVYPTIAAMSRDQK